MRNLAIFIFLAQSLIAGEPAQPGRDLVFLKQIQPYLEGPMLKKNVGQKFGGSAEVEVVGEYSREQRRQIAFQEFQSWFREDLRLFWLRNSEMPSGLGAPPGAMPGVRPAGSATPVMVPLFSKGF